MATSRSKGEPAPPRPRYEIEFSITSVHDDDHEATFKVRSNGKIFRVNVLPSNFINSPAITRTYLSHLEILRSGEQEVDGVDEDDVYEWIMRPCEPLFAQLAPRPASANITVTLKEWLYPDFFILDLVAMDDKLSARRIESEEPAFVLPGVSLDMDYVDDVEKWATRYDAAGVVLSFANPEDALFKCPSKVLIDRGRTACFFKPCESAVETKTELDAYKAIASANLDRRLSLCHFYGVVMDDRRRIVGLLLTYVDPSDQCLFSIAAEGAPAHAKRGWVEKLETTLKELHRAGVVWGDVKPHNVLLDREGNVWMIDFGGGYTEGWVERHMAGTINGDLAGMAKLKEYLLQDAPDRTGTGGLMGFHLSSVAISKRPGIEE